MPKYIVTDGPVEHDGKTYVNGDDLSCEAEVAQTLVDAKVLLQQGRKSAASAPADSQEPA